MPECPHPHTTFHPEAWPEWGEGEEGVHKQAPEITVLKDITSKTVQERCKVEHYENPEQRDFPSHSGWLPETTSSAMARISTEEGIK